jgi:putative tryptophan/tyrosine transport system substrate-binding protein
MRRHEFIGLIGVTVVPWELAAHAQQPAMPIIGYVINGNQADAPPQFVVAFREGLAETGFTEGRNVAIEYRWADGHSERAPALIVGLVRRRVAVIVVSGDLPTLVAKGATGSIPIVFMTGSDPVGSDLVASLNRPGINSAEMSTFRSWKSPAARALIMFAGL